MSCSNPYKFEIGDTIYLQSCTGLENTPCTVKSRYVSDKYNHPADPHPRYVVEVHHPKGVTVSDFAGIEFSKEELMF